jgi:hypothetical protein
VHFNSTRGRISYQSWFVDLFLGADCQAKMLSFLWTAVAARQHLAKAIPGFGQPQYESHNGRKRETGFWALDYSASAHDPRIA